MLPWPSALSAGGRGRSVLDTRTPKVTMATLLEVLRFAGYAIVGVLALVGLLAILLLARFLDE